MFRYLIESAFDSAELDFDLHRVCFEDPDGLLNQTEYTQPCMVAFACGVTAVLAQQGVKPAYAVSYTHLGGGLTWGGAIFQYNE